MYHNDLFKTEYKIIHRLGNVLINAQVTVKLFINEIPQIRKSHLINVLLKMFLEMLKENIKTFYFREKRHDDCWYRGRHWIPGNLCDSGRGHISKNEKNEKRFTSTCVLLRQCIVNFTLYRQMQSKDN